MSYKAKKKRNSEIISRNCNLSKYNKNTENHKDNTLDETPFFFEFYMPKPYLKNILKGIRLHVLS